MFRRLGLALLGVLGLLFVLLLATFVAAQTRLGQSLIEARLGPLLSTPGSEVRLEGLSGWLPFDLALGRLTVGPAAAPWLTATDLRLAWQASALLEGRLRVTQAVVAGLTLHDLPPATDAAEDDQPLELPELPSWLPPVTVDRLAIEQLTVAEAVLGAAATFSLAGRLASDAAPSLTLDVDLARLDQPTASASLRARLEAAPAVLELALRADESGGLLAAATGLAEAGELHLVVEGRGPLEAFLGQLDLEAVGLGVVEADFELGLGAARRLDLALALAPAASLPRSVHDLLGERATLTVAVARTGPDRLTIDDLVVKLGAAELDGSGRLDLAAEELAATGTLVIAELAALAPLIELPLAGAGELQATVQGALARPSGRLQMTVHELQLADLTMVGLEAEVDLDATEEDLRLTGRGRATGVRHAAVDLPARDLELELQGVVAPSGPLLVEHLRLVSAEIALTAAGQLDPDTLAGDGVATLAVSDLGPLGAAFGSPIGGAAELRVEASSGPDAAQVTVELEGDLERLTGLPEALAAVLGSSATLTATAELIEQRRLELRALQVVGAAARLDGEIGLDLDRQPRGAGNLDGELGLALADLGVLADSLDLDLAGGLDGHARLAGTLAAPGLELTVTGQGLVIAGQPLDRQSLTVSAADLLAAPAGHARLTLATKGVEASLSTDYAFNDPVLSLQAIALDAPGSRVDGELKVELADLLVTGRLAGTTDLAGVAPLLPLPVQGGLRFSAELSAPDRQQDARLDLDGRGLDSPLGRIEHLVLAGQLADLLGTPRVEASLTVDDLHQDQLRLDHGQLRARGGTDGLGLELSLAGEATVPFAVDGRGQLILAETTTLRLDRLTGTVAELPLRLEQPATVTLDGDARRLDRLDLRLGEARAVASLALDARAVEASLTLGPTPLGLLGHFGAPTLDGTVEARLTLTGAPDDPAGTLELEAADIKVAQGGAFAELPPARLVGKAELAARRLDVVLRSEGITKEPLTLSLGLPLTLDLTQGLVDLPADGRLEGQLAAELALARLADVAGLHNDRLEGPLQIDLALRGTVATPLVSGSIAVVDGLYEDGASGAVLDQLTLRVEADGQRLTISELSATDGGDGRLGGSGQLVLDPARDFPIELDLRLERARLVQLDDLSVTASGELAIDGNATELMLTGKITVDRADATLSGGGGADVATIEVVEVGGDQRERSAATSTTSTILDLDLAIDLPGRVFVRGFGLVSEWQGQLQVTGPATAPRLGGRLEVRNGHFDLLDRRFDLRRGEILFTGASPPMPMLDIEAVAQTAQIRAIVRIHDRATNPRIDFESEPPLPEDEVLSHVMFGEGSAELSAMQAAQLASGVSRLTGGSDLLGNLRNRLGVDTLDVSQDATTEGTRVRAGKYLSDQVYVEVEGGQAAQSGRARVEVEVLPGVSVQADTGEDQKTGIGVEWRFDY